MIDDITGIILAGGKSTRIGTDKAFLKIGEQTLIEILLAKIKDVFKDTIIIANEVERFDYLGMRVIPDIIPTKGPLGGIYTGLVRSSNFYNFIVACDMPFIDTGLPGYLSKKIDGYDVAVARYNDRLQPLCAFYSKNCIEPIKEQLDRDNLKIRDFFERVKVNVVNEVEISRLKLDGRAFVNINTPEDYRRLKYAGI